MNRKGNHPGNNCPPLKGKIRTTKLKYFLKESIFNFKDLYGKEYNEKCKEQSLRVWNYTGKYLPGNISDTLALDSSLYLEKYATPLLTKILSYRGYD
jgi:hypothetical protein